MIVYSLYSEWFYEVGQVVVVECGDGLGTLFYCVEGARIGGVEVKEEFVFV